MKKQILNLLLILCMVMTLLPTVAFAATNYNIWIGSTQVTSANAGDVLGDGKVSFNAATSTLTLNNANITSIVGYHESILHYPLLNFGQAATLKLIGNNIIDASDISSVFRSCGIFNEMPLTISGPGTLSVKGGTGTDLSAGISINAPLIIDGCEVTSYTDVTTASFICGIWDWSDYGITIKNGATLTMYTPESKGNGFESNETSSPLTIDDTSTIIAKGGSQAAQLNMYTAINNPNLIVTCSTSYDGTDATRIYSNFLTYKYIKIEPAPVEAPSINTQPSNQTVNKGQTASFNVSATSTVSCTYQWQVSTNGGSSWTNVTDGTGGTSESYTTASATAAMNGYKYRCQVTNAGGTATSNEVKLTVLADGAETTGIFIGRYSYKQVFDCQRTPSTPTAGSIFKVSNFILPYNAAQTIFIQFTQAEIKDKIFYFKTSSIAGAPFALYMADDVNGTNEQTVSVSGNIYGLGKEGYIYIDKAHDLGYLISNTEAHNIGGSFSYVPDIAGPITLEQAREYQYGNDTPMEKVMTSITIKTAPKKQTYFEGALFDPTELVITLNYDDSSSQNVAYTGNEGLFTFTPNLTTALSVSDSHIIIQYGSKTANQAITVNAIATMGVTYSLNGGQSGQPTDSTLYKQGDAVSVNFSAVPVRSGYKFLGWDRNDIATTPEFTVGGTKTFVMGNSNVTLYAVWQEKTTVSINESIQSNSTYDGSGKAFQIIGTPNSGFSVLYFVNGAFTSTAPINAGAYTVKITRNEDEIYKAYDRSLENALVINKATPSFTVPINLTATYGQILADVTLPTGFAWTNPTTSVGSAGTKTFTAIYTPTDTSNYNIVSNIPVNIAVLPKSITFSIDDIAPVTYNGTAQTPTIVVKDGVLTLTKDIDYTLIYINNTNVGTATIAVTGKGNYAGSNGTKTFTINPLDITGAVVGTFGALTYNKAAQTPSATVTKNSLTVTGTWSAVTNVGDKTTFTANGNFTGTIANQNPGMAKATPVYTTPTGLTATYGQILADVDLPAGFAWANSTASVGNMGTNSFTVTYTPTDTTNYNIVSNIPVNIAVLPKSITFSIDDIAPVTYNGTAQTPVVVVKDGTTTLNKDVDYTVSYSNNTNSGTATVAVTGKGNYAGSNGTKTFTINRANITNGKSDQIITYAGQTYDVSQLFTPDSNAGTPSYTVENGGTGEGTLSGNLLTITKAGTITIGMETAQTTNYNAGSKLTSTLTINKGAQNVPTGITKLNVSAKGGNDGKIQNVSTAMEYKAEGGDYTDITNAEILWLAKGKYSIRYKQTELYNAGLDTQITINEPVIIKADETVPDGITLETPTQSGDTLEIKVTKVNGASPEITTISGNKVITMVLDITAEVNGLPTATLSNLIKITLPIPQAAKGRNITVYRLHEGTAVAMPAGEENKNSDGEYIVIGTDTIVVYTKNFSQYAIAYKRPSSSGGGSVTRNYNITVTQSEGGKISPDTVSVTKNSSKSFTITPNDGYEIEDVLVNGKSVGKVTEYTFKQVMSEVSITAKFKKIEEKPVEPSKPTEPANPEKWKNPFMDVNENDWFYEAVSYVTENGLMNGTDNTTFEPNMNVTRAMFVTVLYRAEKQPNVGVSPFTDIESGAYYEKAVAWAAANGIVKGVSETEFDPNGTITREQMAAIIQRYTTLKGMDTTVRESTSYADSANISDYAKEAVAFCTEHGFMSGKESNLFAPGEYATRAEVAAVLTRVLKILQ